jgi:two-component system chemotaxis response regulator CheB
LKPIRVVVVDDSPFNRKVISEMLESSDRIEVVARAFDGEDAIRKIVEHNPDAITLDLEMPRMDGFAVLRWLMANRPLPVLVVSSRESNRSVFKALDLGAVDFVVKPSRTASPKLKELETELVNKVLSIPTMKLDRIKERVKCAPEITVSPLTSKEKGLHALSVVCVAASTGGPPAVQLILQKIPKEMISPILICQHMPPIFTKLFAERLSGVSGRIVKEGENGERLLPGHAYVAPGGMQMRVQMNQGGPCLAITKRSQDDRFAPSANYLFHSAAKTYGRLCLAVVLTGMGDDGKEGALEVHRVGGKVIAEDESTAVIFGMPKEVIKAGAADFIAPLSEIPSIIYRYGETSN